MIPDPLAHYVASVALPIVAADDDARLDDWPPALKAALAVELADFLHAAQEGGDSEGDRDESAAESAKISAISRPLRDAMARLQQPPPMPSNMNASWTFGNAE